jgi:Zn ribbon nucleic-acid-binding protein
MNCPNCDNNITIEDWQDDEPFECPECGELIQLITDESTYVGATDTRLIIYEAD